MLYNAMRIRILLILIPCLLLTGCSIWTDGHYHSVTPHTSQNIRDEREITQVFNYSDICRALEDMVLSAVESGTLSAQSYTIERLTNHMEPAIRQIKTTFPLGAYAVEDITYEVGINRGVSAVAITITYNHNRSMLPKIRHVTDMTSAEALITTALSNCDSSLVMYVENYMQTDFLQLVQDYAISHPAQVMEVPQLTENHYPESGTRRVISLQFTYQSRRESLLAMQNYVHPVFSSASLYVSGENDHNIKFEMLSSFLLGRNDYTVETSITPAYSLLRHGVGDSKAFASVYASMCNRVGLNCQVIYGTKNGEPWSWNIIQIDENYYHVDLLQIQAAGQFQKYTDDQMSGYVWDYSAYPACVATDTDKSDGT